jgi:glycosyltransferase involved in cell wall biosynthesis
LGDVSRIRSEIKMSEGRRPVVALVTDAIYPYFRGGKEVRYHEVAQRLAQRAEVHVFTMKWWDGPWTRYDGPVTFRATCRLHPMYSGERRSYREAFFFALSCLRLFRFHFDAIEADQFPTFHIFTLRLITWLKRKPLTVTWHEVWDRAYWCEYLGWVGNIAWLVQWLAMRVPDHLIAASSETAARLREVFGDRASIFVVPNGIDLEGIQNSHPDDMRVDLVIVGRLLPHKNVDMLLESVALLHSAGLHVTCRVIGDGPQRAALHERAEELGISDAVDFRHDVWEQKDLYSLIKAARVAVFPSAREGFGIAVLEAIACGISVVTTSAPDNLAQHLVARAAAGTVCAPSAEAIADTVRKLLADPHGGQEASRGRPAVQEAWLTEHGWDFAADQVARVLGIEKEGAPYVH